MIKTLLDVGSNCGVHRGFACVSVLADGVRWRPRQLEPSRTELIGNADHLRWGVGHVLNQGIGHDIVPTPYSEFSADDIKNGDMYPTSTGSTQQSQQTNSTIVDQSNHAHSVGVSGALLSSHWRVDQGPSAIVTNITHSYLLGAGGNVSLSWTCLRIGYYVSTK